MCINRKTEFTERVGKLATHIAISSSEYTEIDHKQARTKMTDARKCKTAVNKADGEERAKWLEGIAKAAALDKPDKDWQGILKQMIVAARQRSIQQKLSFVFRLTFAKFDYGEVPSDESERVMDVSLILHADHGMNASTFSSMVVASTLSDIYFSIGAGIGALSGPLHGGANEAVLHTLKEIGSPDRVERWYQKARREKRKVMGFGHRVYKAYDPRARILGPLAKLLASKDPKVKSLYKTARALEKEVIKTLGKEKKIFPNVDFYSGIVYQAMGIAPEYYTPIFAVSRVSGWTARVLEYLKANRIFRPRGIYVGAFDREYVPMEDR